MKDSQGKQPFLHVPKRSFLQVHVKQYLRKQGFNCLFIRFFSHLYIGHFLHGILFFAVLFMSIVNAGSVMHR